MISPSQAEHLIEQQLTCLPIESLPLVQCVGAVLRENIYAERDHPPFDRVSMDGIAIDSTAVAAGQRDFVIQGVQAAGDPPLTLANSQHAIEIMTGAVIPFLQQNLKTPFIFHRTLLTAGIGESMLAEQLVNFEATLQPELKLAYLPQYGMVKLRITATGQDQLILKQAIDSKFSIIKELFL